MGKEEKSFSLDNSILAFRDFFRWDLQNKSGNLVPSFPQSKYKDLGYDQICGDISTLWLLINLCNMPKTLVT